MFKSTLLAPKSTFHVEYDSRGQRVSKQFTCPYQARSFYLAKFKTGKNPKVTK